MAEYIDKNALLKKMHDLHTVPLFQGHRTDEDVMFDTIVSVVEEQPIADVVPVVRCKDCKHFNIDVLGLNWCDAHSYDELIECKENDYCNYGERRCDK